MKKYGTALIICILLLIMSGCSLGGKVDQDIFKSLCGDYQSLEDEKNGIGSYWHMGIGKSDKGKPYVWIFDDEAGNPGIQGEIVELSGDRMVICYDEEWFEELPADQWQVKDGMLDIQYRKTKDGLAFINNRMEVLFEQVPD